MSPIEVASPFHADHLHSQKDTPYPNSLVVLRCGVDGGSVDSTDPDLLISLLNTEFRRKTLRGGETGLGNPGSNSVWPPLECRSEPFPGLPLSKGGYARTGLRVGSPGQCPRLAEQRDDECSVEPRIKPAALTILPSTTDARIRRNGPAVIHEQAGDPRPMRCRLHTPTNQQRHKSEHRCRPRTRIWRYAIGSGRMKDVSSSIGPLAHVRPVQLANEFRTLADTFSGSGLGHGSPGWALFASRQHERSNREDGTASQTGR